MVPARAVALTGADQTVKTTACVYRGFSVRETSGVAAAVVRIHDGTDNTGVVLDTVQLAANESRAEWYPDGGIWATLGLHVDVVSGAVEGSVRIG